MTQRERLDRRAVIEAQIAKHEAALAELRIERGRLLEGCEHAYSDGRTAVTGVKVKICAICGRVIPGKDEKLWG